MKAITIKQPWASLICTPREDNLLLGIKDIENRTWRTNYRGRVLIHAAASPWSWDKLINYMTNLGALGAFTAKWSRKWLSNLPTGNIIGSVEIVDCVINNESIWAEKSVEIKDVYGNICFERKIYNWVLANPIKFPEPIPAKGKLSFWDYPNILAEPEEKDGKLFCHCQLPVKEINQVRPLGGGVFQCRYCGGYWYK